MSIQDYRPELIPPATSYRFLVGFLEFGIIPNPLDIRFQKVSGLSFDIETQAVDEGGENIFAQSLPQKVKHGNLVLERGMVLGSPLNINFNLAMNFYTFNPCNVMVAVLNEDYIPTSAWLFIKAYPVKWAVSDLDANSNSLVIDTFELAYQQFQIIRV